MTFEERCRLSEQCLPEAPYREMLTKLHNEMLEVLAQPVQLLATGFCTHEWIDDTKDKPQWRCVKCGKNYRREQA
jgi:hypothetical protein